MNILKNIFSVKNTYKHLKKFKVFTILGFKIKFRIKNTKKIREFVKIYRPQPLSDIMPIGKIPKGKDTLAICAIFKNEPDIIEWIEYHMLVGVERFYLYDNESDYNYLEILKPYIDSEIVIYHYVKGRCLQNKVYRDAVYRYKNKTKWFGMIDLDEYIVPVEKDNIIEFLKEYEKYPAVGVNWRMFDSNGFVRRPNKLVIESYTRCDNENIHIKSIFKTSEVKYITNPHFCFYKNNKLAVNENKIPIGFSNIYAGSNNCFNKKISYKKIQINHYHTKSYEDYLGKMMIGYADSKKKRDTTPEIYFSDYRRDYVIQKYLEPLKSKMESINSKILEENIL